VTDPNLIARLRHAGEHIYSIQKTRASDLLMEASDALEKLQAVQGAADDLQACKADAERALGATAGSAVEAVSLLATEHLNLQRLLAEASAAPVAPTDVPRLDYTKPPPGFMAARGGILCRVGAGDHGMFNLQTAWAHYKAHNHPPGMPPCHADHRAAAWAWHDRRLDASSRLAQTARPWPRLLAATNQQMLELERWLDAWDEWAAPAKPRPLTGPKPKLPLPEILHAEDPEVGALQEEAAREAAAQKARNP